MDCATSAVRFRSHAVCPACVFFCFTTFCRAWNPSSAAAAAFFFFSEIQVHCQRSNTLLTHSRQFWDPPTSCLNAYVAFLLLRVFAFLIVQQGNSKTYSPAFLNAMAGLIGVPRVKQALQGNQLSPKDRERLNSYARYCLKFQSKDLTEEVGIIVHSIINTCKVTFAV